MGLSSKEIGAGTPPIAQADKFMRWPLYSAITVLGMVSVSMLIPAPLAVFPIFLFLLALILGLVTAAICHLLLALWRHQWHRAASMLAFPALLPLFLPAIWVSQTARDELRFQIHKSRYEAEVTSARAKGEHSRIVDDWSVFVTANSFVVWDDRDNPEQIMAGYHRYQSFGSLLSNRGLSI